MVAKTSDSRDSAFAATPFVLAHMRTRYGSLTATGSPSACRLLYNGGCHLPVASATTMVQSKPRSQRLSWRMPSGLLATHRRWPAGRIWASSQLLPTSIPALDCILVACSDNTLPCMRDELPIICSGQQPRNDRTKLTHGPKHQAQTPSPDVPNQ